MSKTDWKLQAYLLLWASPLLTISMDIPLLVRDLNSIWSYQKTVGHTIMFPIFKGTIWRRNVTSTKDVSIDVCTLKKKQFNLCNLKVKTVSAYTHNRYLYISRQHNIFFIFNGRTRYEKRSSESKHLIKNGTKNDRLQVRHCVWGGGLSNKKRQQVCYQWSNIGQRYQNKWKNSKS